MTELLHSFIPKALRCNNASPKPAEKALKAVFTGLMSSQTFRDAFGVCDSLPSPTATAFSIASKLYQMDVFSSVDIHPVMLNLLKWWTPSPSENFYSIFTGIADALLGQMPLYLQGHFKDESARSFVLSAESDRLEDISSALPALPSTIIALAPHGQFFKPVDGLLRIGNVNYAIRTTVDFTGSIQLWWQPSSQWFSFCMNDPADIPSPTKFDFGKPSAVFLERLQPNQPADDVSSIFSTSTVDWPTHARLACAISMEPGVSASVPSAIVRTYGKDIANFYALYPHPAKYVTMVQSQEGGMKLQRKSHKWEVDSTIHNLIDKLKSESVAEPEGCVVFMQCGAVSTQNLQACRSIKHINEIAVALSAHTSVAQKAELIQALGLAMCAQDRLKNFHLEARIDNAAETTAISPQTFNPMTNGIKMHSEYLTEIRIAHLGSLWPTFAESAQGIFCQCKSLLHIDFSNDVINKGTLRCLFDAKKKAKGDVKVTCNIVSIVIINCKLLETGGVEDLSMIIKGCSKTLRILRLSECGLEMDKPAEAGLLAAIASCTKLNRLSLLKNKIADAGAKKLAGSIECLTYLMELDLYNNRFVGDGGPAIANAIKNCSYMRKFKSNLLQGSSGGVALSRALQQSNNIHHLHLAKNMLRNDGMRAVCMDLGRCRNLLTLDLMGNDIGDAGARDLANTFQFMTNLQLLNLYENTMTEGGGAAIARELRKLPNLTTFHSNRLGVQGCLLLAGSMESLPKLTSLLIAFNNINSEGMSHLAPAISKATQLVNLDIQSNKLGDAGLELLSSCMSKLTNLKSVSFGCEDASSDKYQTVLNSLKRCPQLLSLKVEDCKVPQDLRSLESCFCDVLQSLPSLVRFNIPDALLSKMPIFKSQCNTRTEVMKTTTTLPCIRQMRTIDHMHNLLTPAAPEVVLRGTNTLLRMPPVLGDRVQIWMRRPDSDWTMIRDIPGLVYSWITKVPSGPLSFAVSTRIKGVWTRIGKATAMTNCTTETVQQGAGAVESQDTAYRSNPLAQLPESANKLTECRKELDEAEQLCKSAGATEHDHKEKVKVLRSTLDSITMDRERLLRSLKELSDRSDAASKEMVVEKAALEVAIGKKRQRDEECMEISRQVKPKLQMLNNEVMGLRIKWQRFDCLVRNGRLGDMTGFDIVDLLNFIGLHEYAEAFNRKQFDGKSLSGMLAMGKGAQIQMFATMDMSGEHRNRLMQALNAIKSADGSVDAKSLLEGISNDTNTASSWTTAEINEWLDAKHMPHLKPKLQGLGLNDIFGELSADDIVYMRETLGITVAESLLLCKEMPPVKCGCKSPSPAKATAEIPKEMLCPISMELMSDPVVASDGFTYDRSSIQEWFNQSRNPRSPMTNQPLGNLSLFENKALKGFIEEWRTTHNM